MPFVVRKEGALYLEVGAGATANHEPRTFDIPISEKHLEAMKADLTRHILLWCAILPLCDAAGTQGPIDEQAAIALLDPILFGSEAEVEALLKNIPWYDAQLIAHHADHALLERGEIFAATRTLTPESDYKLAEEYYANRRRAERGVQLAPLDTAILKYTNQYIHGASLPTRKPDVVDPALLSEVMQVITTAERVSAGMELPVGYTKEDWRAIETVVAEALNAAFPELVEDSVRTVCFLICSEAAVRGRAAAKAQQVES